MSKRKILYAKKNCIDPEEEGEELPFPPREIVIHTDYWVDRDYEIVNDVLGRGKFGEVKRCKEVDTGLVLAAKLIKVKKMADKESVKREIDIMSRLRHPKILQIYDAFEANRNMCIITEIVEGGELFDRIVDDDFELTERVAILFMRQIVDGIAFIHSQSIIHLDMKPENIICVAKTGTRIKIIDFGLAMHYDPIKGCKIMAGTIDFMAPEVCNYENVGPPTDMWSVGVICYVLVSGLSPFCGDDDSDTICNIINDEYDFAAEEFEEITAGCKDFIKRLLVRDLRKRMTASECLKHSWLQKISRSQTRKHLSKKHHIKFFARKKWRKVIKVIVAVIRMKMLVRLRCLEEEAKTANIEPAETVPVLSWKERMDLMKRKKSSINEATLIGLGITAAARRTRVIKSSTTHGEAYHTSVSSGYESSSSSNTTEVDEDSELSEDGTTPELVDQANVDSEESEMATDKQIEQFDENRLLQDSEVLEDTDMENGIHVNDTNGGISDIPVSEDLNASHHEVRMPEELVSPSTNGTEEITEVDDKKADEDESSDEIVQRQPCTTNGSTYLKEYQFPVTNTYMGGTSYTMASGVKERFKPKQPQVKEHIVEDEKNATLDVMESDIMTSSQTDLDVEDNKIECQSDDRPTVDENLNNTIGRYYDEAEESLDTDSETSDQSSEEYDEDEMPTPTAARPEPMYPSSTRVDSRAASSASGSSQSTSDLGFHFNSSLINSKRHSTSDLTKNETLSNRRLNVHGSTGELHINRPAESRAYEPEDLVEITKPSTEISRLPKGHLYSANSSRGEDSDKPPGRPGTGQLGYRRSSSKKLNSSCEDIPEYQLTPPLNTLSRRQARVAAILGAGSTESSDGSGVADNPMPTSSSIQLDGLKEIPIKHDFETPPGFRSSSPRSYSHISALGRRAHPSDEYFSDTNYGDSYENPRRRRSGSYGPTPISIRHGSGGNTPLPSYDRRQPKLSAISMDNDMHKESSECYYSPRRVREWSVESDQPGLSRGCSPMNTIERRRARIAAILNNNDETCDAPRPRHRSGSREASIGRYRPA